MSRRCPTGREYHAYFNPERSMPAQAEAVHGLSEAFLADKPRFAERAQELLDFLGDSPLVAHNATVVRTGDRHVKALVPVTALGDVAGRIPGVSYVRTPIRKKLSNVVATEGRAVAAAVPWHTAGVRGQGGSGRGRRRQILPRCSC